MQHADRPRLGELLMTQGALDAQGLHRALDAHRRTGTPLGKAILQDALCPPAAVWAALSQQLGLPFVSLSGRIRALEQAPTSLLPSTFARTERMVPLWIEGKPGTDILVVGLTGRARKEALLAAERHAQRRVEPRLVSDDDFEWALRRLYPLQTPLPSSLPAVHRMEDRGNVAPRLRPSHQSWDRPGRVGKRRGELLLYGWPRAAASGLVLLAASEGHCARPASSAALGASGPEDVAVLSVREAERLASYGIFPHAELLLTSPEPERDRARARRLGARELLLEPIDADAFLRVLRSWKHPL